MRVVARALAFIESGGQTEIPKNEIGFETTPGKSRMATISRYFAFAFLARRFSASTKTENAMAK
jgi:hypothetical protein